MTLYLLGPARSCDKLKATYIHPHNTYSDKLGRVVIYHDELLPIKTHDILSTWACKITWKTKNSIFLLPQYLWPKNSRLMTSNAELPLIKLHHPSIMRFCEVTWQIKYFLSPLVLDQWPPNMVRWWLPVRVLHP